MYSFNFIPFQSLLQLYLKLIFPVDDNTGKQNATHQEQQDTHSSSSATEALGWQGATSHPDSRSPRPERQASGTTWCNWDTLQLQRLALYAGGHVTSQLSMRMGRGRGRRATPQSEDVKSCRQEIRQHLVNHIRWLAARVGDSGGVRGVQEAETW